MGKCGMNCKPNKSFGSDRSNENKRNWSEEKYIAKNTAEDKNHHYDITRRDLNFQVVRKDGKTIIEPLDPNIQIDQRLQARLDELGFKGYKEGAKNAPISSVSIVFSGDTAVMRELAFGKQHVDFDLKRDNSHIKRKPGIERMAIAAYNHACRVYGEENIIDFSAHLDEVTPHFHCLVVPTAQRKSRGRAKTVKGPDGKAMRDKDGKPIYETKTSKLMVSFSGFYGDNSEQRADKMERLQTAYWEEVGQRFGLERADCLRLMTEEERKLRKAKNSRSKVQLEADRLAEIENAQKKAEAEKLLEQAKTAKEKAKEEGLREAEAEMAVKMERFKDLQRQLVIAAQQVDAKDKDATAIYQAAQALIDEYKTHEEAFKKWVGAQRRLDLDEVQKVVDKVSAGSMFTSKTTWQERKKIIDELNSIVYKAVRDGYDNEQLQKEIIKLKNDLGNAHRLIENREDVMQQTRGLWDDMVVLHPEEAAASQELSVLGLRHKDRVAVLQGHAVIVNQSLYDKEERKRTDPVKARISLKNWGVQIDGKSVRQWFSDWWQQVKQAISQRMEQKGKQSETIRRGGSKRRF